MQAKPTSDEASRQHYLGKYRGIVVENRDPGFLGRLQAEVPAVLGDIKTAWAMPCAPYAGDGVGFFAVPPVGAGVWIEFEEGDVARPIWSGCWWGEGQVPGGGDPKLKVWKTDAGHSITLDDARGRVEIVDGQGSTITLDASGVKLEVGSSTVEVADGVVKINGRLLEV